MVYMAFNIKEQESLYNKFISNVSTLWFKDSWVEGEGSCNPILLVYHEYEADMFSYFLL